MLKKREIFRSCFASFDYDRIAAFTDEDVERIMNTEGMIRSPRKILSGFYGVVKPMDGVVPYRLEMQAKAAVSDYRNLYDFWGDSLYREVVDESRIIVNLASKEYSKCIEKYLKTEDYFITCVFGELDGEKIVQKGVYAKMARGEMVRYMAANAITQLDKIKAFDWSGYRFREDLSSENEYVFIRTEIPGKPGGLRKK